jgi:signal transduction histidine kinase
VLEECDRLRKLVNQLLTLAEVDREKIGPASEILDLEHVVRKSCDMFQAVAETQSVSLVCNLQPTAIRGDAARMRQVINNLLDNALKYTPTGGTVNVDLFVRPEPREVVLTVADTGPGIDDLDLPFIFDRFYRGDKSRHRVKTTTGTGLGLSIVYSTVTGHGGQISATSQRGKGTTFTVILPSADEPTANAAANETAANEFPGVP